jgi:hypothetical protein
MADQHVPDLNAIRTLPNPEIKFYATIGAVISLGAALELAYFDVFEKATKLNQTMAASIFYEVKNTSARRDIADSAMRVALHGHPELPAWADLYKQITGVTGGSGERNLLGHNVVKKEESWPTPSGFLGGALGQSPSSMSSGIGLASLWGQEPHFFVSQDQAPPESSPRAERQLADDQKRQRTFNGFGRRA